jgi:hypothetical protein
LKPEGQSERGSVMKTNVTMEREIVIKVPDKVGTTMLVAGAIAEADVNIIAICGYSVDNDGHLRVVTSDNAKALAALTKAGFKAEEHDVVRCEVSPNVIHPDLGSALGGFEVENNYWCAAAHGGEHAVLYFTMKGNIHPSSANI